jgi:hypothetical protein
MTNALQNENLGLSPSRLEEITSIFELHNRLSTIEASDLAITIQETNLNNIRALEAI